MKLYGSKQSACTRSVTMVMVEKGASTDFVDVELSRGEHRGDAHLARNPFGRIPVLEHEGLVVYESQAINRYLDAVLPGPALMPAEPAGRAVADQWLSIDSCYFQPQAYNVVLHKIFLPMMGGQPDLAVIGSSEEKLAVVYQAMDAQLARGQYLAGGAVTLADLAFVQYTDFLLQAKCEQLVFAHENVRRWWHAMSQRESYKNTLRPIL